MKKLLIFVLTFSFISFCFIDIRAIDDVTLTSDAKSAILMELSTKTIIYEKNSNEVRPPASMTKVMTMLLVLEAIENNVITYETMISASELAVGMGGSQIYLEVGEQMSVDDLFKSVCIASANDAAVALAEAVGGSYDNFIKMMNDKALELNMVDTVYKNANGLPEEGHVTSAKDMAILSCYILEKYGPQVLKYTNIYEDYVRKGTEKEFWLVNTNKLVKFVKEVDGLKTGWTEEAGYCLSATMQKNDVRYVAVIMGCSTSKTRNAEIMQMFNYASNSYELVNIYKKDEVIKSFENVNVTPNVYNIVVDKDINILKKKGEKLGEIKKEVNIVFDPNNPDVNNIGVIEVYMDGNLILEEKLSILEDLKKTSLIDVFFSVIKEIFLIPRQ